MAFKPAFELDAGKILAKLHRAGCQSHEKQDSVLFFNSGIVSDQQVDPENCDKSSVNFDLDNKSGEYELGVVFTKMPVVAVKTQDDIKKIAEKNVEKEKKQEEKTGAKPEEKTGAKPEEKTGAKPENQETKNDENAPITENPKEPESKSKVNEGFDFENNGFLRFLNEFRADLNQISAGDQTERKNYVDTKGAPTDPSTVGDVGGADWSGMEISAITQMAASGDAAAIAKDYDNKLKTMNVSDEVKNALQKNMDHVKKQMETLITYAFSYLTDYMTVFCGPDESHKIKIEDMKATFLPKGFTSPYKVKKYDNYQIPAMSHAEARSEKIEWMKKNEGAKEYPLENMCFKIGYSVEIGK